MDNTMELENSDNYVYLISKPGNKEEISSYYDWLNNLLIDFV